MIRNNLSSNRSNSNKKLTLTNVTEKNQKVYSSREEITIGRNPDSKIVLKEDYISRQHCKITYKESN